MPQYCVRFASDYISPKGEAFIEVPNSTNLMNEMAKHGWRVISCVPGTNAQTFGGLFITFEHD